MPHSLCLCPFRKPKKTRHVVEDEASGPEEDMATVLDQEGNVTLHDGRRLAAPGYCVDQKNFIFNFLWLDICNQGCSQQLSGRCCTSRNFCQHLLENFHSIQFYTLCTTKLFGGILVSLRPSVRPASRVRSVAPTVLVWIHFIFIHLIKQLQKKFIAKFPNLNFCLVWVIMGGISERRRSSCSS